MGLPKSLTELIDTICSISEDMESALKTFEDRFAVISKGSFDKKPLSVSTQKQYHYLAEKYIAEKFVKDKGDISDIKKLCSFDPETLISGWAETTKMFDVKPDLSEEELPVESCSHENEVIQNECFIEEMEDGYENMVIPEIMTEMVSESNNIPEKDPVYSYEMRVKGTVAGIDVHKDDLFVTFMDKDGSINVSERDGKKTWIVKNTASGLKYLIDLMKTYNIIVVGFESTSVYWIPLAEYLIDSNIYYVCANATELKSVQGKKTDKIDSTRIALATRDGRLSESKTLPKSIYLRNFLRLIRNYYHLIHGVQNRILAELWLIDLDPHHVYSNTEWKSPAFNEFLAYLAGLLEKDELSYPKKFSKFLIENGSNVTRPEQKIAEYRKWVDEKKNYWKKGVDELIPYPSSSSIVSF